MTAPARASWHRFICFASLSILGLTGCGTSKPSVPDSSSKDASADAPPADSLGSEASETSADSADDATAMITTHGSVLTRHNDSRRTGTNLQEHLLTPVTVPALRLLARIPLNGEVYAQPLYAPGVMTGGTQRNLVVVATMSNTVYAFDADAGATEGPIWAVGVGGELGTPGSSPRNVNGPNGILSTPVIDPDANLIYVLVRACSGPAGLSTCEHTLYALDLGTGNIVKHAAIGGTVLSASGASIQFDPNHHWSRAGLLLNSGFIYAAFGAGPNGNEHEEDFVYHGWVFKISTADLKGVDAFCTTADGMGGGIWQGGGGLTLTDGGIFAATGNGIHIPVPPTPIGFPVRPVNYEDSLVRLPTDSPWSAPPLTFFDDRSYDMAGDVFQYMEKNDVDFSSGGPAAIPGSDALVASDKSGTMYLLRASTLAPLQAPFNGFTNQVLPSGQTLYITSYDGPRVLDSPVVWRADASAGRYAYVYAWAANDWLKSFRYDYTTQTLAPFSTAPGGTPVSSGGMLSLTSDSGSAGSAVLWSLSAPLDGSSGGQVTAFDADSLKLLWTYQLPARSKFVPPTIADGKVFVPSTSSTGAAARELFVFGL